MEVDPEVQALLDDIPAVALPEELIHQGWGRNTVDEMVRYGITPRPPTEGAQSPVYEDNCMECGRPVTMQNGYWRDHANDERCDGLLVDEQFHGYHVTAKELDGFYRKKPLPSYAYSRITVSPSVIPNRKVEPVGPCPSIRTHHNCRHECDHTSGHFGFHECKHCHHLWH